MRSSLRYTASGAAPKLPGTLSQLTALEQLDLVECYSLQALPDGIGRLTSLKHLVLEGCDGLQYVPDSIMQLAEQC